MSSIVKGIIGVVEVAVGIVTGQPWLIAMGVATLISTAASLFNPAKKSSSGQGLQTQIGYDPTFARQLITGRTVTAGSLAAQFTHDNLPGGGGGTDQNRVLELVIALADHECDALEQIIVNGQVANTGSFDSALGYPITTTLNPNTGLTSVDYSGKLWVMFHSGADGQAVDAHLNAALGSQWPSTSVGENVCYVRITAVYDQALFGGIPQFQFVVRGAKLYDPRKDSTVGGSGSHVWGDTSTYEWSDNLALIAYNVARGVYVGGKLFYGAGAAFEEVPFDVSAAAMNACDEDVTLKAGGTEKRYVGGGQVSVSQDSQSFLSNIAIAMGGYIGTGGGTIAIIAGVAQTPIFEFTDDDIMAREPYDNAPKFGLDSLKNSVTGTFVDPAQNWTRNSAPKRVSTDDITEDGGTELADSYTFDLINSGTQAQRVMEVMRRRNRCQITQTITLRPSAIQGQRGDWLQWSSDQWGYNSKAFLVVGDQVKPNLDIVFNLVEIDTAVFGWVAETDELPPAGGLLASADPPGPAVPSGVSVAPLTLLGDTGRSAPSFQVVFADPNDDTIDGFEVEYRLHGTTHSQYGFTNDVAGGLLTLPNLVPNSTYDYRYRFIGINGRVTPWSAWATFVSSNTKFVADDLGPAIVDWQALSTRLFDQNVQAGLNIRALLAQVRGLSDGTSEVGIGTLTDRQVIDTKINSTSADLTADYEEKITAATGPDSAIVTDITTLTATIGGAYSPTYTVASAVTALATTVSNQGGLISANSSSITSLSSTIGGSYSPTATVATAITGLSTTVTSQGSSISANSISITALSATIGGSYSPSSTVASAVSTLTATTSSQGSAISSNSSSITSLSNTIGSSYNPSSTVSSAISGLTSTVSSQGSSISSNSSSITSLSNTIGGSFSPSSTVSSAISGLSSTVSSQGSAITANSSAITALTADVGNFYASGLFRVSASATASGAYASIELSVAASGGGSPSTASMFMDAMAGGGSQLRFTADAFQIMQSGSSVPAFVVSGGLVQLNVPLQVSSVDTGNLVGNSVSNSSVSAGAGGSTLGSGWTNICTVTQTVYGGEVLLSFSDYMTWSGSGPKGAYRIINQGSSVITQVGFGGGSCPDNINVAGSALDTSGATGSLTWILQGNLSAGSTPTSRQPYLIATELKR